MSESASLLNPTPLEGATSPLEHARKSREYIPGECSGKWSHEEHLKYIAFIDFNREIMKSKQKRRSNKFYQEMANFIQTRNALQCRSHHQKLEEKYTHPFKIVSIFKSSFCPSIYKEVLQNLQDRKKAKQNEKYLKELTIETSQKNVETQTASITLPKNNLLVESTNPQYTNFPFFGPALYPTFINEISAYTYPMSFFVNSPYDWNQAIFAYGFDSY